MNSRGQRPRRTVANSNHPTLKALKQPSPPGGEFGPFGGRRNSRVVFVCFPNRGFRPRLFTLFAFGERETTGGVLPGEMGDFRFKSGGGAGTAVDGEDAAATAP